MSDRESSGDLRPLGRLEHYYIARNSLGYHNSVSVTVRYEIASATVADAGGLESVVFATLHHVIPQHPSMGVSILNESLHNRSWKRLETIDLRRVVEFITSQSPKDFVQTKHALPFEHPAELPLWRLVVANQLEDDALSLNGGYTTFDVGFFFHHAIADGKSGIAFHKSFAQALNELCLSANSFKLPPAPVMELKDFVLLPSLEQATPLPMSLWGTACVLYAEFLKPDDSSLWTGPNVVDPSEKALITRLSSIHIANETTKKISQFCRQHKVTITPLLTVLVARVLSKVYPTYSTFIGSVPMSLRRLTAATEDQMVTYVSNSCVKFSSISARNCLPCNSDRPLEQTVVRACKAQIDAAASSNADHNVAMLRYVTDFSRHFSDKVGKKRHESFKVTNLGLVDLGVDGGPVACKQLLFAQTADVTGMLYAFHVASLKDGDMTITLSWQKDMLEEDKVAEVMRMLETELLLLVMS